MRGLGESLKFPAEYDNNNDNDNNNSMNNKHAYAGQIE
jgi:hypothetical protein